MNLENITVLVTRPRPFGEVLCQKIEAALGHAIYLPTIDILPPQDILKFHEQINELNQYDWLIFMSPQAVYQSAPFISQTTTPIAAVGLGTASILKKIDLPVHIYPEKDWRSEGLLALPAFQQVQNKKIALISGDQGREFLAEQLALRGAVVTKIITYRRALPQIDWQKSIENLGKVDIIVCTSNEIMQNLKRLFADKHWDLLRMIKIIVISERMVHFAKALGFQNIILADNASHDAIMATLLREKELL